MASLSGRLQAVIEYKKTTTTEFERLVGVSKGVFAKAIKNDTNITSIALEKIASFDPEININWLLTGKGSMFLKSYDLSPYEENESICYASQEKENGYSGRDEFEKFEFSKVLENIDDTPTSFAEKERILLNIINNMSEAMRRNAIANENNSINMRNIMDAYSEEKKKQEK